MARDFDGTNDRLAGGANTVSAMDAAQMSFALWVIMDTTPAAQQVFVSTITQNNGSNCAVVRANAPVSSPGWQFEFTHAWTSSGVWSVADVALNTRTHIAITYDRGSSSNDPVMYLNGVSQSVTEETPPSGSPTTGGDTIRMGENAAGTSDLNGTIGHVVATANASAGLWSAAEVNRAMWWGRPRPSVIYYPLVTTKLAGEGTTADTLTATGTTMVAFATPVVRPGSAMMGMGIGW